MEGGHQHRLLAVRYAARIHYVQVREGLQRRFGIIPGITDKGYITNSYHVHVTEKIDAFDKLKFESAFQRFPLAGPSATSRCLTCRIT